MTAAIQTAAAAQTAATAQTTAATRMTAIWGAITRDSVSISSAARAMAQSSALTGSAAAPSASQTVAVNGSGIQDQVSISTLAREKAQSVKEQGLDKADTRVKEQGLDKADKSVKEQGLDKADKRVNGNNGNNGNGYGNTNSVGARADQQAVIVASRSRLSAADAAFVNRAKGAQHQDVEGHHDRGNAGKSGASQMRAQFAQSRAALMSSMVANSGFRGTGMAVSSRSALDMFRATLPPANAIAAYINSLLMETIGGDKDTGIYATLASGAAAANRVDLLG
ncbi:MAG: hypothetical protein V3R95_08815 [Dehalococcoidia bacterium]